MKNTYYSQKFTNEQGEIVHKYVWSQDIDQQIYPSGLTPVFEEINEAPHVGKMTTAQIQADRKRRSSQHFKKEILPTLGSDEQKHFKNKYKP